MKVFYFLSTVRIVLLVCVSHCILKWSINRWLLITQLCKLSGDSPMRRRDCVWICLHRALHPQPRAEWRNNGGVPWSHRGILIAKYFISKKWCVMSDYWWIWFITRRTGVTMTTSTTKIPQWEKRQTGWNVEPVDKGLTLYWPAGGDSSGENDYFSVAASLSYRL